LVVHIVTSNKLLPQGPHRVSVIYKTRPG